MQTVPNNLLNTASRTTEADMVSSNLAETINGLCKAELIRRRGPWRSFEAVE